MMDTQGTPWSLRARAIADTTVASVTTLAEVALVAQVPYRAGMQKSVMRRLFRGGAALIVIGLAYFSLSMGWLTGRPMGYGPWSSQADRIISVALVVIGAVLVVVAVRLRAVNARRRDGELPVDS